MITDTVKCRSCYKYGTLGHTYCECGLMLPGASDDVKKQIIKNVINCFNVMKTSAFVLEMECPNGEQLVAVQAPKFITRRVEHYTCAVKRH